MDAKCNKTEHDKIVDAFLRGDSDIINITLSNCATSTGNIADSKGNTLLMAAAFSGNLAVVKELVERGADVNAQRPNFGSTALISAVSGDSPEVVQYLLDNGADPNARMILYGMSSNNPVTALTASIVNRKIQIMRILLSSGVEVLDSDIIVARKFGGKKILRILEGSFNDELQKILVDASNRNITDTLTDLVEGGVDLDLPDVSGDTSLIRAASNGYTLLVSQLIEFGADLNARNYKGQNALIKACIGGYSDIVNILIDNGAKLNGRDMNGRSALMIAAHIGAGEIVNSLLLAGADPTIMDDEGMFASDYAQMEEHNQIVDTIISFS